MARAPVNELVGEDLLYQIWEDLPPYAEEHMKAVFIDHDEEAASRLVSAAPNGWRGHIANCAFLLGVSNPTYRAIVRRVWDHDHSQLLYAVDGDASRVREILAAADFAIPLNGNQVVYRGAPDVSPEAAVEGLSWTTSHEVACWFAFRSSKTATVLAADVPASEIIYWSNERGEHEVILQSIPPLRLDDQSDRWEAIASSFSEKLARAHKERFQKVIDRNSDLNSAPEGSDSLPNP